MKITQFWRLFALASIGVAIVATIVTMTFIRQETVSAANIKSESVGGELNGRPLTKLNEQGRTVPVTYDDMLVEIGRRVPGFAGVYTDPNNKNRSVIALTDLNKAVEAQGAVRDVLGSDFIKPGGVITETAQYDVISLSAWHRALSNSVAVFDQVVYTDMDEYMNRVEIAVLDLSIESEVRAAAKELGIPQEAVVVTLTEPVRLL